MDQAGFTRFADLDATALLRFQRSLAQRPGTRRDALAPTTVQKYLYLLTYLHRFCDELDDGLRIDPFPGPSHGEAAGVADAAIRRWPQTTQAARVRLSIDDFGTGHSSLSYIRKLPVQEIKIDRSFVMEMDVNRDDATIVRTTVNMCHDLGYEVVAEGVENASTCDLLSELGCDFVQGYHIARPMNRQAALDWLSNTNWQIRSAGGESHAM